jgi:hypothetical protein
MYNVQTQVLSLVHPVATPINYGEVKNQIKSGSLLPPLVEHEFTAEEIDHHKAGEKHNE